MLRELKENQTLDIQATDEIESLTGAISSHEKQFTIYLNLTFFTFFYKLVSHYDPEAKSASVIYAINMRQDLLDPAFALLILLFGYMMSATRCKAMSAQLIWHQLIEERLVASHRDMNTKIINKPLRFKICKKRFLVDFRIKDFYYLLKTYSFTENSTFRFWLRAGKPVSIRQKSKKRKLGILDIWPLGSMLILILPFIYSAFLVCK